MSGKHPSDLMPETEIRAALRPWQTDRQNFEVGVQSRIEDASHAPNERVEGNRSDTRDATDSHLLQIAASVMPAPMISGKFVGLQLSLGKASVSSKLIALAAWPAISLFMAFSAFIFAALKIRSATRVETENVGLGTSGEDENGKPKISTNEAMAQMWEPFHQRGLRPEIFIVLMVVLTITPAFGIEIPYLLLFAISAFFMTILIAALGRHGMMRREIVARACVVGLTMLAQPVASVSHNSTVHFWDQHIAAAVLLFGSMVIVCCSFSTFTGLADDKSWNVPPRIVLFVLSAALVAFFSQSLWRSGERSIRAYVEAFDSAPHSSANWRLWNVAAGWLLENQQETDLSKPRNMLEQQLDDNPNVYVLGSAAQAGILHTKDVARLPDFETEKKKLLDELAPRVSQRPFFALEQKFYLVYLLYELGEFSVAQLDCLEQRCLADVGHELNGVSSLHRTAVAVRTLEMIDRPLDRERYREHVHQALVRHQSTGFKMFSPRGGFSELSSMNSSGIVATADAIELMQTFGVPEDVDLILLRSYLRPQLSIRRTLSDQEAAKSASRQRLNAVPDAASIHWWEYIRYEQNIISACLLVLLCWYATFVCPKGD